MASHDPLGQRLRAAGPSLFALVVLSALLAWSAPLSPDDWDGLGFIAAVDHFDLSRFAPHPPGYPVYVAALRAAHFLIRDPLAAAYAVSIASAAASATLAFLTARRLRAGPPDGGPPDRDRAAWPVACAVVVTPIAWRAMSAVGSEGLALALLAAAVWSLVSARQQMRGASIFLGTAVGLGLGVRLSWAPLFVPLLLLAPRGSRLRATSISALASIAWVVPLAAIVGPSDLLRLYGVHAQGHASRWGGTAITDPGAGRLVYLARDIFIDGLGAGSDALGVAIGVLAAVLGAGGLARWHRAGWRGSAAVAFALLPYVFWIAVGQNLREQPRHAVPLVVALAAALAFAATHSPRLRALGAALAVLIAARTALDATARRSTLPPGAQLAAYVSQLPDVRGIAIFAGPSARFFEGTALADRAAIADSLDDARLGLTRLNDYPRRVLVTSELEGIREAQLPLVATFCRPPRLDRRAPCLSLYEWSLTR